MYSILLVSPAVNLVFNIRKEKSLKHDCCQICFYPCDWLSVNTSQLVWKIHPCKNRGWFNRDFQRESCVYAPLYSLSQSWPSSCWTPGHTSVVIFQEEGFRIYFRLPWNLHRDGCWKKKQIFFFPLETNYFIYVWWKKCLCMAVQDTVVKIVQENIVDWFIMNLVSYITNLITV